VINRIEQWIEEINEEHLPRRKSCVILEAEFKGFYPTQFLEDSYFVVAPEIPKPDFPELRDMGLGEFIDMQVNGVTYMNTYYLSQNNINNFRLHFHELVHVAQWGLVGAANFIGRYISEIQRYGYHAAPLEEMAYALDQHYSSGGSHLDVPSYVQSKL